MTKPKVMKDQRVHVLVDEPLLALLNKLQVKLKFKSRGQLVRHMIHDVADRTLSVRERNGK